MKTASAQVAEERGRLAVEVGDGQVERAVAVEVAAGDPHAGLVAARGIAGHAGERARPPRTGSPRGCGTGSWPTVVGDEEVDAAVVVEVGGDDAQAAAVAVDDPGLGRDVDEPAAVVAEEVVGQ